MSDQLQLSVLGLEKMKVVRVPLSYAPMRNDRALLYLHRRAHTCTCDMGRTDVLAWRAALLGCVACWAVGACV